MGYRTASDLCMQYDDPALQASLARLFGLREFYREAVRDKSFAPTSAFSEALRLIATGDELLVDLQQKYSSVPGEPEFVIFLLLYHEELLVDPVASDLTAITNQLNADLGARTIRYPWLFDHQLYDKAYSLFPKKPDTLTTAETEQLLSGTPMGVFQLADIVVGPFGVLVSPEKRYFPPRLDIPLWHCEDPMCGALHVAELAQPNEHISKISKTGRSLLAERYGPISGWKQFVFRNITDFHWYDDFSLVNLPWFLGSAFSEGECRTLLTHILRDRESETRAYFTPKVAGALRGQPEQVSARLDKTEALQIIFLERNCRIAQAVDELIDNKAIYVPPTELRKTLAAAPVPSWAGAVCECSNLGLRVVGNGRASVPMARLRRLVLELFPPSESGDGPE